MQNVNMLSNIIQWCNENVGFATIVLSELTLFVSIIAVIVSIRTARLPYKKLLKIEAVSYYTTDDASGLYVTAINCGNMDFTVSYIGFITSDTYYEQYHPQVLRFDAKTKIEKYHAVNFGACKGETFDRVLIFPNGPLTNFVTKDIALKSPEKYYVGVTRPRFSIAIVMKKLTNTQKDFELVDLVCRDMKIKALRFLPD